MAILAFLPEREQDEVIRYNLPRMRALSAFDEGFLRAEMARGAPARLLRRGRRPHSRHGGLGVPIFGRDGHAVAALSVGSTTDRMTPERNQVIADLLKRRGARDFRTAQSLRSHPAAPSAAMEGLNRASNGGRANPAARRRDQISACERR